MALTEAMLKAQVEGKKFGSFSEEGHFENLAPGALVQEALRKPQHFAWDYDRHVAEDYMDDAKFCGGDKAERLGHYLAFCRFVMANDGASSS